MRGGAGTPVFARFENVRALRRMLENARRNGMTDAVAAIERRIAELEERARPWFLNTAEEYVRLQRAGNPHANRGRLIQMLGRHGAVESISLLATRPEATAGFEFLRLHGRLDISFERFVADNPAMFDEEVVAVASGRLAVVRAGAVPNSVTATAPQISPTAGDVEERGAARGVGRWWAADSAERYWLEATDRDDIGSDLRAPELDGGGRPNWRYGLFEEARPGDVVLHYDKDRGTGGIVGFSRIAPPGPPPTRGAPARVVEGATPPTLPHTSAQAPQAPARASQGIRGVRHATCLISGRPPGWCRNPGRCRNTDGQGPVFSVGFLDSGPPDPG